jgi:hypothetical protein
MTRHPARFMTRTAALYSFALFGVALMAGQVWWAVTGAGLFIASAALSDTVHAPSRSEV